MTDSTTGSIRQVLVHLDATESAGARLRIARDVASGCGASLNALYAVSPCIAEMPYVDDMTGVAAQALAQIDSERRAAARAEFDRMVTSGAIACEWAQTDDIPVTAAFVRQALFADLLVLGQRDAGQRYATALPMDFNESVVIASGRPALVIPCAGNFESVGKTIVIAWKPTREAARAVTAALPLLRAAKRVHVVLWGAQEEPRVEGKRLDLAGYLHRHGIEATRHHEGAEPESVGELLLSRACDLEADLLVMGCYGHSRARELVLGGVSRTIMRSMTMPVLLAH